jgi:hypothetical protein
MIFLYSFRLRFPFNRMIGVIKRNLQAKVQQRLKDLKSIIEKKDIKQHHKLVLPAHDSKPFTN